MPQKIKYLSLKANLIFLHLLRACPSQSNNISHNVTMESVIFEHVSFKTTILNAAPDLNDRTSQTKINM